MKRNDTSPRHSVLLDQSGAIVRRCPVPRGVTFVLNPRDGRYYDRANPTTFVQRSDVKVDYLSVPCPVQTCTPFPGFACRECHVDPIHRSRIVAALKAKALAKASA